MDSVREIKLKKKMDEIGYIPLDILVVGATGVGKSTTLNSIMSKIVSNVGEGVDPETQEIKQFFYNQYLRLWDSPGLGDGIENDKNHIKKLIDTLYKTYTYNNNVYGLIDMVLVIIDGSSRDMGTVYKLITDVIIKNFPAERVLVSINQADQAMKGNHWNYEKNTPDKVLKEFLDEKVLSIKNRIKEATKLDIINPIYFSASKKYNMNKLYDLIIDNIIMERRII